MAILIAEVLFFAWYLWPEAGRAHPFLNAENALLILKYSSIYGIAAVGAAVVIISGGIDLAPGAVIALAGVVTGHLFVVAGLAARAEHRRRPARSASLSGLLTSLLIVIVKLPPFIATLGMMGITRGIAFIITEGQYYDVSSRLPAGWRPLGVPIDWLAPIVMFAMAVVFQILMTRFQWGRSVFSIGGNETAALFSGIAIGRVKASVYVISGVLASLAGVVLVLVQGQGKADLATGYELDIIASAVVGGASLAGGRGSVMGAVLGTLIFGVLRNALPQIPGATFYDRLIVGLVVIVIVVADQLLLRRRFEIVNRARVHALLAAVRGRLWRRRRRLRHRLRGPRAATDAGDAAQDALRDHSEGARHSGLQLREDRRRARGGRIRRRRGAVERAGVGRSVEAEGNPRVLHHAARRRHRDLGAQRRVPHRDDQPRHRCRHSRDHLGFRCAEVEAHRVLRRRRSRVGPHHGRAGDQAAERQGQGRADHQPRRHQPAEPARTA